MKESLRMTDLGTSITYLLHFSFQYLPKVLIKSSLKVQLVKRFAVSRYAIYAVILLNCSSRFNLQCATRNFKIKTCNSQFSWNLQFLTHYTPFRNLPRSSAKLLVVESDSLNPLKFGRFLWSPTHLMLFGL